MRRLIKNVIKLNENKKTADSFIFYHATSLDNFKNIKKEGKLSIKKSISNRGSQGIYLTDDLYVAKNYGVGFHNNKYVIIKINGKHIDTNYLIPDDYELIEYLEGLDEDDDLRYSEISWKKSLELVNQVIYLKDIKLNDCEIIYP